MAASPDGISWLNQHVWRPLSHPSNDMASQRIWLIRSASRDGGRPSPSGRSGRSSLTILARVRRSWSLPLTGVLIAAPFPPSRVSRYAGLRPQGIGRTSDSGRATGLPTLALDRSRNQPEEIVMNPVHHI